MLYIASIWKRAVRLRSITPAICQTFPRLIVLRAIFQLKFTPPEYIGIYAPGYGKRAVFKRPLISIPPAADMHFRFPLAEVIFDFYDKLKSYTRGYASFDYEFDDYRDAKLVKLDILINGEPLDALSTIVHTDKAYEWGNKLCRHLKELIPRQMFEVAIQAAIGYNHCS